MSAVVGSAHNKTRSYLILKDIATEITQRKLEAGGSIVKLHLDANQGIGNCHRRRR